MLVKIIILIFVNEVLCFNNDAGIKDIHYVRACNLTSPINAFSMNNVFTNKNLENNQSKTFKCFLHCLLMKYGWMDEDGGFLIHDMRETLQQSDLQLSTLEYILYSCTTIRSVDRCHRAYFFTDCFWKKMEEEQPTADDLFYNVESKK